MQFAISRRLHPRRHLHSIAICLLALAPSLATAQDVAPPTDVEIQQSVAAGREALNRGGKDWYDSETDDVRRIKLRPADVPQRSSSSTTTDLSGLSLLLKFTGWTVLIVLLAALAWLFIWAWLRRDRSAATASDATPVEDEVSDVDRVEALPFRINRQTTDLLSEARRCYEAGDFSEAIVYLFSHELVELDRHQLIRLARGKTNRQCVREIAARRPLMLLVSETMVAFEDVFFGGQTLSRARFEACWFRVEEFGRLVREGHV